MYAFTVIWHIDNATFRSLYCSICRLFDLLSPIRFDYIPNNSNLSILVFNFLNVAFYTHNNIQGKVSRL